MRTAIAIVILATASTVSPAAETLLFGLPLGGKAPSFRDCTHSQIGRRDVKCAIERTSLRELPTKAIHLQMPDADVPTWVGGSLSLTVDKRTHEIDEIRIWNEHPYNELLVEDAVNSISARFGPVKNLAGTPRSNFYEGLWEAPNDLKIKVFGSPKKVQVVFQGKRAADRHEKYLKDMQSKMDKQPKTP